MELLLPALLTQLFSIIFMAFLRDDRKVSALVHLFLLIGLSAGLSFTYFLISSPEVHVQKICSALVPFDLFRFDPLGLYFLFIVQLAAIPVTIYSYSYLQHYIDKGRSVKSFILFYVLLVVSTQLLVITNHTIMFLICWEVMSTSAYLGMIFENEKKEVQDGSFYYLIVSRVIVFFLYIFFFLLHRKSGSWLFSDFHISPDSGNIVIVLYLLALAGFGMKAGFMPMHFWLPKAHPIAPTVFSAFLSGIIIKTGIYGILRTFQFINPVPEWIGWLLLAVSLTSAVFGVWYALAQHDIKKLLAYHSVENIGIIGIGISIGFMGSAYNSVPVQMLGFGGALLHTLNHAVFKSLLFIGSGIIYQNLGTRSIELMGGLVHRGKYFVILFLTGTVAISGIPPLNGFISEFIIYIGFFTAARELHNYYPLLMLVSAVGLAFVGGLAAACFTKINSIMFLGSERKEVKQFNVSVYDYLSMGMLAVICIGIGLYPYPVVEIINRILVQGFVPGSSSTVLLDINWSYITAVSIVLVSGFAVLYFLKIKIQKKYGSRVSPAWGCGYEKLTPAMQYTASSYADQLNEIPKSILVYQKKISAPDGIFPVKGSLESRSDDLVEEKFLLPVFRKFSGFISGIEFFTFTDIRYYIASILVIIIIYSLIGFIWT